MSVRKREWKTKKGDTKQAWVVDYVDQAGTRRLKTFAKKKQADVFIMEAKNEVKLGLHIPDRETVTVSEAGEQWLAGAAAAGLERTSIDQCKQHLNLHIAPYVGHAKLTKVTVPFVRAFQDQLRADGRSDAMVKRVTTSLGSILADAQERGLTTHNAVREMSKRRARGKERRGERRKKARLQVGIDIPTPTEVRAIIEHATGRYRPLIVTAIFSGMRASELRGLRWSDVDLDVGQIHIRQRADRYQSIGMPKTDAGQRTIPIPPIVINTLRVWKLQCPKGKADLVFPNGKGNIEWHSNIIKRGLAPTLLAAGVTDDNDEPKYTGLHCLRHFFASWCINRRQDGGLELPAKIVQARLGHSSIQMTMDTYSHLFPSTDDAESLAAAERVLLSAVNAT